MTATKDVVGYQWQSARKTRLLTYQLSNSGFTGLVIEMLARNGLRKGELMNLAIDAVVQIGSAYWLRVPVRKLHNDRYIPLHPQLKTLLDEWLADRPEILRSDLIFLDRGRPIPAARVDRALTRVAEAAGIARVTAHQLRHALATQAIAGRVASDASVGGIRRVG